MPNPYIGEIRMFAGNFAPINWLFCDGALIPISEYDVLFTLIGTTYGGDGVETFRLPDLRGRIPIHMGTGGGGTYVLGQTGGTETVTLTTQQIPGHAHAVLVSDAVADTRNPKGARFARARHDLAYAPASSGAANPFHAQTVGSVGGGQAHNNMQPYLCVGFIISTAGIFPSQA